jgi:hypothetical protein
VAPDRWQCTHMPQTVRGVETGGPADVRAGCSAPGPHPGHDVPRGQRVGG